MSHDKPSRAAQDLLALFISRTLENNIGCDLPIHPHQRHPGRRAGGAAAACAGAGGVGAAGGAGLYGVMGVFFGYPFVC
jgi:hypothetical protein